MSKSHCAECVKNDEDCCSSFHSRFVTLGDAQRIAKLTGMKPRGFLKFADLSDCDKRTDLYAKKLHGYYYDIALDGKLLQLKTKKNLACMFFQKGSCQIYPSRPLACRVFPFWFSGKRIIVDNNGFDCPIVCGKRPLAKDPPESGIAKALGKMDCDEREMRKFLSQLRKEIEEYRTNVQSFVKKNRIGNL